MTSTDPPSRAPARRVVVARVLLVGYVALLALAVLAPTSGRPDALLRDLGGALAGVGVPARALRYDLLEGVANVVIVVPVGALGSLSFPRLRWQDWAAYAFVGALGVEVVQGVLLPARDMSATDVVANTLGALVGAGLVVAATRIVRRRGR